MDDQRPRVGRERDDAGRRTRGARHLREAGTSVPAHDCRHGAHEHGPRGAAHGWRRTTCAGPGAGARAPDAAGRSAGGRGLRAGNTCAYGRPADRIFRSSRREFAAHPQAPNATISHERWGRRRLSVRARAISWWDGRSSPRRIRGRRPRPLSRNSISKTPNTQPPTPKTSSWELGVGSWELALGRSCAARRASYFAVMMKWPRRFIMKHASVISMQSGSSSPLLIASIRSAPIPRLTR